MRGQSALDVVVVGAGIVGASCAWWLQRSGRRVVILDAAHAAGEGSTASSLGILRFHTVEYEEAAMALEGFHYWRQWGSWLGNSNADPPRFLETGSLLLETGDGYLDSVVKVLRELGVLVHEWGIAETRAHFPYLDLSRYGGGPGEPDGVLEGGVFTPWSGYITDPVRANVELLERGAEAGITIHYGQRVSALRPVEGERRHGRVRVEVEGEEDLFAHSVLLATGPPSRWLLEASEVLDDFNVVPRPLRVDVSIVSVPGGVRRGMPLTHLVDRDLHTNVRPEGDGLMGGREQSSTLVDGEPECGWPVVKMPTQEVFDDLAIRLACRIPDLGVPSSRRGLVAFYDVTPDWRPIYDRTAYPGVYVAVGTSGNQFKTALFVGRAMATLINEVDDGRDHDTDPVRVPGSYVPVEVNMGAFSRMRDAASARGRTIDG